MKKILIIIVFVIAFLNLNAQRNWQSYTNTSHMRDMLLKDDNIIIATWGGVEFFDVNNYSFIKTLTNIDGLRDIDVRVVSEYNEELQFAIYNKGIDRYINNRFDISLSQGLGLSSLNVKEIYNFENMMFVGTDDGLIVFENSEIYPFPLFKNKYDITNGLTSNVINSIIVDTEKYLYLGTDLGISKIHLDSLYIQNLWQNYTFGSGTKVFDIAYYSPKLALATSNGLYVFEKENLGNPLNHNTYFNNNSISQVVFDNQDVFCIFGEWRNNDFEFVGDSLYRTIGKISSNGISLINYGVDELIEAPLTNILINGENIYATSWGKGLYIIDKSNYEIYNFKPNCVHSNVITRITVDKGNKVWFSDGVVSGTPVLNTMNGVSYLDINTQQWGYYNVKNSQLHSDNIFSMTVGSDNKKWFGSWFTDPWEKGITVLDDSNPNDLKWTFINRENSGIYTNTISNIYTYNDKVYVLSYDGGVNIFSNDLQLEHQFRLPFTFTSSVYSIHKIPDLTVIGSVNQGIILWNNESLPHTNGTFWHNPGITGLSSNSVIRAIDSWETDRATQVWIASSNGLYMMEKSSFETTWFKYDIDIKRRRFINGNFENDMLYFFDEERIFGAEVTNPTCLVVDPFGRVWIGSEDKGLSMYDIQEDRFYNYKITNSPLISNNINSLAYHPVTGQLFIGTSKGVSVMEIGKKEKTANRLGNIVVWPNPFKPNENKYLTIKNIEYESMPVGNNECRIFDASGQLIITLQENRFMEFSWDGNNQTGDKCSSGLYFYLIKTSAGDTARGKIVLIR